MGILQENITPSHLLFAIGRNGVISKKIFSHLNVQSSTPTYILLIMGALILVCSLILSYQRAAELLNFGAFLAFMGVNIATFRQFFHFTGFPMKSTTSGSMRFSKFSAF